MFDDKITEIDKVLSYSLKDLYQTNRKHQIDYVLDWFSDAFYADQFPVVDELLQTLDPSTLDPSVLMSVINMASNGWKVHPDKLPNQQAFIERCEIHFLKTMPQTRVGNLLKGYKNAKPHAVEKAERAEKHHQERMAIIESRSWEDLYTKEFKTEGEVISYVRWWFKALAEEGLWDDLNALLNTVDISRVPTDTCVTLPCVLVELNALNKGSFVLPEDLIDKLKAEYFTRPDKLETELGDFFDNVKAQFESHG